MKFKRGFYHVEIQRDGNVYITNFHTLAMYTTKYNKGGGFRNMLIDRPFHVDAARLRRLVSKADKRGVTVPRVLRECIERGEGAFWLNGMWI